MSARSNSTLHSPEPAEPVTRPPKPRRAMLEAGVSSIALTAAATIASPASAAALVTSTVRPIMMKDTNGRSRATITGAIRRDFRVRLGMTIGVSSSPGMMVHKMREPKTPFGRYIAIIG